MNVVLITEGATDQIILKPIVECIFSDEDVHFHSLQPALDHSDRQSDFGGWLLVLQALARLNVEEVLSTNDLIVVHIDTDVSHLKGFDVPQVVSGGKLDAMDLCMRVVARLQAQLPDTLSPEQAARFVFAIGVQSLECWLVGLVDGSHGPKVVGNCLARLNEGLLKQKFCSKLSTVNVASNRCMIVEHSKNNGVSRQIYFGLSKLVAKRKSLEQQAPRNVGFELFVTQLRKNKKKSADN